MDTDRTFQTLAEKARQSRPPLVDVSGRVMARLEMPPQAAASNVLMWIFSATATAAAAACILLAMSLAGARQDPLADMLSSMMQVM